MDAKVHQGLCCSHVTVCFVKMLLTKGYAMILGLHCLTVGNQFAAQVMGKLVEEMTGMMALLMMGVLMMAVMIHLYSLFVIKVY